MFKRCKKVFLGLFLLLCMNSMTIAQPTISGITGTAVQDGTILITGTGFGVKANANPAYYDDVDVGAFSNKWNWSWVPAANQLQIDNTHNRSVNSAHCGYYNLSQPCPPGAGGWAPSFFAAAASPISTTWYGSYWFMLGSGWEWPNTTNSPSTGTHALDNVKFYRQMPPTAPGNVPGTTFSMGDPSSDGTSGTLTIESDNRSPIDQNTTPPYSYRHDDFSSNRILGLTPNTWHLMQFETVGSTTGGSPTGWARMWLDGTLLGEAYGLTTCGTDEYCATRPNQFGWNDSHNCDDGLTAPLNYYVDEAYLDVTLSRVEIGNASTYAACTHREIQIPTAWNSNGQSISATVNLGSFTSLVGLYAFVVDASGVASPGYPLSTEKWVFSTARANRDSTAGTDSIFPLTATITHFVNTGRFGAVLVNDPNNFGTLSNSMANVSISTWPPATYASMAYFNLDPLKIAHPRKKVDSAYLWMRVETTTSVRAAADSIICMADTVAADTIAVHFAAVNDGQGVAERAHQLGITWNEIQKGSGFAWSPTLVSRTNPRKFGIHTAVSGLQGNIIPSTSPQTYPVTIRKWVRFDVKDLVQAHLNGTPNAGWWFWYKSTTYNGLNWGPYHFDASNTAYRPFLEVNMSNDDYESVWPTGTDVAACFVMDDGSNAWAHYARKADSLGIKITFAPEVNDISDRNSTAKPESLLQWHNRGHEIGNQGWFTDNRTSGNGAISQTGPFTPFDDVTPGNPDFLGNFIHQMAKPDSIHLQLKISEDTLMSWGLPKPRTYVTPFVAMSTALEESLYEHGYIASRGTTKGSFSSLGFPTVDIADVSGRPYRVPVIVNPTTPVNPGDCLVSCLVVNGDEAATRANMKRWITEAKHRSNVNFGQMICIYAHSYADLRYEEFAWLVDEMKDNGVYIDTFGNLMTLWRKVHRAPVIHNDLWVHTDATDFPSITSVTGNIINNSTITIAGSRFRTKETTSKVILGDAATYPTCTTTVDQTITDWNTDVISAIINRGTLSSSSDIYLFVQDSETNITLGYLVAQGGVSIDLGPPGICGTPIRQDASTIIPTLFDFSDAVDCVSSSYELSAMATRSYNSSVFTQWSPDNGINWAPVYGGALDQNWSPFGTGQFVRKISTGISCALDGTLLWRMRVKNSGTYVSSWYPNESIDYVAPDPIPGNPKVLFVHRSNGQNIVVAGAMYDTLAAVDSDIKLSHWYLGQDNISPYGAYDNTGTRIGQIPAVLADPIVGGAHLVADFYRMGLDSLFTGTGPTYTALRDSFTHYDAVVFKHCNDNTFPPGNIDVSLSTPPARWGTPETNPDYYYQTGNWKNTYNRVKNSAFLKSHPSIRFIFLGTTPGPYNRTAAGTYNQYTQAAADSCRAFNTWMTNAWDVYGDNIYTYALFDLWAIPATDAYRNFLKQTYLWDSSPACGSYSAVPLVSCNDHVGSVGSKAAAGAIVRFLHRLLSP